MGIQDRDYYREDYAKKNGMRYHARTATYSTLRQRVRSSARQPVVWHWSLIVFICLAMALVAAVIVRYFGK